MRGNKYLISVWKETQCQGGRTFDVRFEGHMISGRRTNYARLDGHLCQEGQTYDVPLFEN